MKLMYYSEKIKKLYNSEEELRAAEEAFDKENEAKKKLQEECKERLIEVKNAFENSCAAEREYRDLKRKYCEDYQLTDNEFLFGIFRVL